MSEDNTIDEMIAADPELLEGFVSESRDCLLSAEDDLNAVSARTEDFDPERIERAFRSIHSLKSAAGFLGLNNVAALALRMEKLLGKMRMKSTSPEGPPLEALLKGVALLKTMFEDVKASGDIETEPLLTLLSERMSDDDAQ